MDGDHPCGGPKCRKKKISQEDAWAILDGFHFCSQACYMAYVRDNYPVAHKTLVEAGVEG